MSINDVFLRTITASDTSNIVKWRNLPSVRTGFETQGELTAEKHEQWLKEKVFTGKVSQFIIVDTTTQRDIGSTFLKNVDRINRKAEFGIFIGEDCARGKGFGSKAASAILQHGFNDLKLNRIYLRVFSDNIAGIRAYEKAGFSKEGLLSQDIIVNGTTKDIVVMAILKQEWVQRG